MNTSGGENHRAVESPANESRSLIRVAAAVAALVAIPALLVADSAAAFGRGWPLREAGGLSLLYVLAVLWLVLSWPMLLLRRRWRRSLALNVERLWLVAASVALAIVLGEWLCQVMVQPPSFHARRPNERYEFDPDPRAMPGVRGVAPAVYENYGWREFGDAAGDDLYEIVCVGGSTTECLYLDSEEAWPARLSNALTSDGVSNRVTLAAVGSLALGHHWRLLRSAKSGPLVEADCVILMVGANDLIREILQLSSGRPAPPLWYRSAWARTLRDVWNGPLGHGLVYDANGQRLRLLRSVRVISAPALETLPRRVAEFTGMLEDICRRTQQRGQALVLVTHPVLWDERLTPEALDRLWLPQAIAREEETSLGARSVARRLRHAMEAYGTLIRDVAAKEDVVLVDAADGLSGVQRAFYDGVHLNEAGCRMLAERIKPALSRRANAEGDRPADPSAEVKRDGQTLVELSRR